MISLTVTVSNTFPGKVVLFMLIVMGGLDGATEVAVVGADSDCASDSRSESGSSGNGIIPMRVAFQADKNASISPMRASPSDSPSSTKRDK